MTTVADLEVVIAQQAQLIQTLSANIQQLRAEVQQQAAAQTPVQQPQQPEGHRDRKFSKFAKELCPDGFSGDGGDKNGFRHWAAKTGVYMSLDYDKAIDIMKWAGTKSENITSDEFRIEAETNA